MYPNTRPPTVPPDALWLGIASEWCRVRLDAQGRPTGKETRWYADGVLKLERYFRAGQLHGGYACYHDNGEIAQAGLFVFGRKQGVQRTKRCVAPSRFPWLPTVTLRRLLTPLPVSPSAVWAIESHYEAGDLDHFVLRARDASILCCQRPLDKQPLMATFPG